MPGNDQNGFWIVPFGIDGIDVGIAFWRYGDLSARWLAFFRGVLQANPCDFDHCLGGNLSHVRVKLTSASASRAALVAIYSPGRIAASLLFLTGQVPGEEPELVSMFVESLRIKTAIVKASAPAKPFEKLFEMETRPLVAVVPWPNEVTDHELVREVGLHLAAAFILEKQEI